MKYWKEVRIMNKIKKALYGASTAAMALAPALASAQFNVERGGTNATGVATTPLGGILVNLMNILLGFVGVLGIIGFVVAGIMYLTAAGDEDQVGKAKNMMMYAIIGVIVALLGYVVIRALGTWLSGAGSGNYF